jgi:hypothetical protein
MKPRRDRQRRDPFADESTVRFDSSAIPTPVDDETTLPVDAEDMAAAARRSRDAPDPNELQQIVQLPLGGGPPVALTAHAITATGAALAVPVGLAIDAGEARAIVVEVVVLRGGDEVAHVRVPAQLGHYRPPARGAAGGLSLRWTTDDADPAAGELKRLLALVSSAPSRRR